MLRLNEAKQVEAKAARIKDWVTNKLRDVSAERVGKSLAAQRGSGVHVYSYSVFCQDLRLILRDDVTEPPGTFQCLSAPAVMADMLLL